MANYYQGETIKDTFSVVDPEGNLVSGASVVVDETIAPDGGTFSVNVTDLGSGMYEASFVAAQYGSYYYRVFVDIDPAQYFDNNFDVDQVGLEVVPVTVVGISSPFGNTLYDLIRAIATTVGDFRQLIATSASPNTQWVDAIRLSAIPANAYKGANLWMVGPNQASGNFWAESRITASSEAYKNVSLDPSLPVGVSQGDIAWVTNLNSRGHSRDTYIDTINNVVQDAFPNFVTNISAVLDTVVSLDDPSFTVPDQFTHVYALEAQGIEGLSAWFLPQADQNIPGKSGWYYDYASRKLVIGGYAAQAAVGQEVRLLGYGREGILVNPGDTTALNRAYLVRAAAEMLKLGSGDQKMLASASMYKNQADELLVTAVTMFEPNTIRIR